MTTMNRHALEIVNDYYKDLMEAFKTGHINFNKLHLAEDASYLTPKEQFGGKKLVEQMLQDKVVPFIKKYVFVHQLHDAHAVCSIIECVTKKGHTVPMVEWMRVHDGKIAEIQIFLDPARWEKAIG